MYIPYSVLPSFPRATSSRVYTQWHMAQSLKPSLWPLVTGIYPIPSAGSVYDDLVLFLHAFTPLITFGLICNSFRFACFVNSSLRFLIPNLHPICTCSCLFTPLTEGRSARDLTQAATSQKSTRGCWHSTRSCAPSRKAAWAGPVLSLRLAATSCEPLRARAQNGMASRAPPWRGNIARASRILLPRARQQP